MEEGRRPQENLEELEGLETQGLGPVISPAEEERLLADSLHQL